MKIILFFLLSLMFSGELEVEGGITATGEIQSPTIDSLLQVIAQLQSQLSALQGGISQKVFEFTASSQEILTENELIPGITLRLSLGFFDLISKRRYALVEYKETSP